MPGFLDAKVVLLLLLSLEDIAEDEDTEDEEPGSTHTASNQQQPGH